MKELLKRIAHTGIDSDTSFQLRNKLKVFNNAILVITAISIFYFVIGIVNHFYYGAAVTFFSVFSNMFSLYLVKKKRYLFSFHYMMWYGFIFLSAFSYLFGAANNSYYYFLFMPVVCNILFDQLSVTLFYLCASSFMMTANVIYIDYYEPYYVLGGALKYFSYPNVLFASALVFLGVRLFKQENLVYSETIEEQKKIVEEKNREITDSINYAKKIQGALIPSEEQFASYFKEAFVLFKPKDIVSGDFYWISKRKSKIYYATADCTGHGVPGGFMTMLGITFLDEIVNEKNIEQPAEILNALRDKLIITLKQTAAAGENKDGMDIALCCFDVENKNLQYAGANNSLYILRDGMMIQHKPDKQPCGFYHELKGFTNHSIHVAPGDIIYTFSDGYADQFGGPKGKKFKYKQLHETIVANSKQPMAFQKTALEKSFEEWRKPLEQIDDVLLIGVRV